MLLTLPVLAAAGHTEGAISSAGGGDDAVIALSTLSVTLFTSSHVLAVFKVKGATHRGWRQAMTGCFT